MKISLVQMSIAAAVFDLFSAAFGQNLTGSVSGADTGSPLAGATVIAVQRTASSTQAPTVYKAVVNAAGQYAMTLLPGQYQTCVHGAGLYLDPCLWGSSAVASVTSTSATSVPMRLQKGSIFIVRIHDPSGYLAGAETVHSSGVAAFVRGAGVKEFPLPEVYDNGRIRDYGSVVPINTALDLVVSSGAAFLADRTGAAPNPQGISLRIVPPDLTTPSWFPPSLAQMFPPPTATIIHFNVTGLK